MFYSRSVLFFIFSYFIVFIARSQEKDFSSGSKIHWMSWNDAVKANDKTPKKIFIDIYTDWCGWCHHMDKTTFSDPQVIQYMNDNFYAVKLDAEMKDSIQFRNQYFINPNPDVKRSTHTLAASLMDNQLSYPTFVMLDENYTRLDMQKGFKDAAFIKQYLVFYREEKYKEKQK